MLFAEAWGNDEFSQRLAEDFLAAVPKGPYGCGIKLNDLTLTIYADNAIQRRFQDGSMEGLEALTRLLCLFAFGTVHANADQLFGFSISTEEYPSGCFQPAHRTIRALDAVGD